MAGMSPERFDADIPFSRKETPVICESWKTEFVGIHCLDCDRLSGWGIGDVVEVGFERFGAGLSGTKKASGRRESWMAELVTWIHDLVSMLLLVEKDGIFYQKEGECF